MLSDMFLLKPLYLATPSNRLLLDLNLFIFLLSIWAQSLQFFQNSKFNSVPFTHKKVKTNSFQKWFSSVRELVPAFLVISNEPAPALTSLEVQCIYELVAGLL